jgi:hypothetical protein
MSDTGLHTYKVFGREEEDFTPIYTQDELMFMLRAIKDGE